MAANKPNWSTTLTDCFCLAVTAKQYFICRLWSYCLSLETLRPSVVLSSEDIRTLWHYARFFHKKERIILPRKFYHRCQRRVGKERKNKWKYYMKSQTAKTSLFHLAKPRAVCFRACGKQNLPFEEHPRNSSQGFVPCSCSSHSYLKSKFQVWEKSMFVLFGYAALTSIWSTSGKVNQS